MRYRVLPYKQASRSARALADELGGRVLLLEGSRFVSQPGDCIINWGNSEMASGCTLNNDRQVLSAMSNKLTFFNHFKDEEYIPKKWVQQGDIPDEAFPVVCRTVLTGHSGQGIHIADSRDGVIPARMYVQYMKKREEYRIHCGKTADGPVVIAVQRKARKLNVSDSAVNWRVRNLVGGFVYTREGFELPAACRDVALDCFKKSQLDFGAVDVIWNDHSRRAYVLEINTAPGLEGTTVKDYAKFFKELEQ